MVNFEVFGPFPVPVTKAVGGRHITQDNVREFWDAVTPHTLAESVGCYVFTLGSGRRFTPYYVGKSTRPFKREIFTPHKKLRYHEALVSTQRRKPSMFFLRPSKGSGKKVGGAIGKLEKFLISAAVAENPNLVNVRGTKAPKWAINGVLRSRGGKPSTAAYAFRSCMGL